MNIALGLGVRTMMVEFRVRVRVRVDKIVVRLIKLELVFHSFQTNLYLKSKCLLWLRLYGLL